MNQLLEEPKVEGYNTDPYSARVLILKMEEKYNLTIRVYEGDKYCNICIDKEEKEDG